MWEIRRYQKADKKEWDAFVERSRNATFLFARDYMDYHSERFPDFSLIACRNGRLAALLPATRDGETLSSHRGLTYGGWVVQPSGLDAEELFGMWRAFLKFCRENEIERIEYKPLPRIYAEMPSDEDRYLLFLCGAAPTRVDLSSAIEIACNPGFNTLQRRHLKHIPADAEIRISVGSDKDDVQSFHDLLRECLDERHGMEPVHTCPELQSLMEKFPENIKIWSLNIEGKMEAAVCAYITKTCLHCQYIATSGRGRRENLLAAVVEALEEYCGENGIRYLDFGISTEEGGRRLNTGLNRQKTSYGASGVAYERYDFSVSDALAALPSELWPRP